MYSGRGRRRRSGNDNQQPQNRGPPEENRGMRMRELFSSERHVPHPFENLLRRNNPYPPPRSNQSQGPSCTITRPPDEITCLRVGNIQDYMALMIKGSGSAYLDLKFLCADGWLMAHKLVISNVSPFLASTFCDQMPGEITVISCEDMSVNLLLPLLDLAYKGSCVVSEDLIPALKEAMMTLGWVRLEGLKKESADRACVRNGNAHAGIPVGVYPPNHSRAALSPLSENNNGGAFQTDGDYKINSGSGLVPNPFAKGNRPKFSQARRSSTTAEYEKKWTIFDAQASKLFGNTKNKVNQSSTSGQFEESPGMFEVIDLDDDSNDEGSENSGQIGHPTSIMTQVGCSNASKRHNVKLINETYSLFGIPKDINIQITRGPGASANFNTGTMEDNSSDEKAEDNDNDGSHGIGISDQVSRNRISKRSLETDGGDTYGSGTRRRLAEFKRLRLANYLFPHTDSEPDEDRIVIVGVASQSQQSSVGKGGKDKESGNTDMDAVIEAQGNAVFSGEEGDSDSEKDEESDLEDGRPPDPQ